MAVQITEDAILEPGETAEPFFFKNIRLMLLGIDESQGQKLVYLAQTKPNGPWAKQWGTVYNAAVSAMATGNTLDGSVCAVLQPVGKTEVLFIEESGTDQGNMPTWKQPVSLGLPRGVTGFPHLALGRDSDGRVEVFGAQNGGAIWWKYQNPVRIVQEQITITPPGSDKPIKITVDVSKPPLKPWSEWIELVPAANADAAEIQVANNADDTLTLIVRDRKNDLFVTQQTTPHALAAGDWSRFQRLSLPALTDIRGVAPGLDEAGALNLFCTTGSGYTYIIRQNPPCSTSWSRWSQFGILGAHVSNVAASIDGDGHLLVTAVTPSSDGRYQYIWVNSQVSADNAVWAGWRAIGLANGAIEAKLNYNADGRLTLFFRYLTLYGIEHISQLALDSSEWDAIWIPLSTDKFRAIGIVQDATFNPTPARRGAAKRGAKTATRRAPARRRRAG